MAALSTSNSIKTRQLYVMEYGHNRDRVMQNLKLESRERAVNAKMDKTCYIYLHPYLHKCPIPVTVQPGDLVKIESKSKGNAFLTDQGLDKPVFLSLEEPDARQAWCITSAAGPLEPSQQIITLQNVQTKRFLEVDDDNRLCLETRPRKAVSWSLTPLNLIHFPLSPILSRPFPPINPFTNVQPVIKPDRSFKARFGFVTGIWLEVLIGLVLIKFLLTSWRTK